MAYSATWCAFAERRRWVVNGFGAHDKNGAYPVRQTGARVEKPPRTSGSPIPANRGQTGQFPAYCAGNSCQSPPSLIAQVKRIAQHQGVSGRTGAVIGRIHVLCEEISGESPAGAEIGEARGVLRWARIHREERVFDAGAIGEPVGEQVDVQIVRLPDVQK